MGGYTYIGPHRWNHILRNPAVLLPDKVTSTAGGGNPILFPKNKNKNLITIAIPDVLFIPGTF